MEYAESIPVVGDFSQIISKICGFFVDMEDEVIIQKMHELISFNYTVVGELEDQICETVVMFMNHAVKTSKIRNLIDNINAEPEGLFQRFKKFFSDIGEWLQDKKNSFFMGLRGYEKPEQIIQENLAIIDVGLIISVMLKMKGSSSEKRPVLTEAANWVLEDSRMEDMLAEAP